MQYKSTRSQETVSTAEALLRGLAADGGLYVPEVFPENVLQDWDEPGLSYQDVALHVLSYFFSDLTAPVLQEAVQKAYGENRFDHADIVPFYSPEEKVTISELFHGATLAFKDLALSIFPYLLSAAKQASAATADILILTATSGDTGKAALEAFKDVEGVDILVFYPAGKVSPLQELQMQTQTGKNVKVVGLVGNFDQAQTFVKEVFTDPGIREKVNRQGYIFSSANSINIGRLLPQIAYYVWTYRQLVERGCIERGESFNVVVPSGNFGNILAAFLAQKMGIPIGKFVCASNRNHVLTDFLMTGTYDRNRDFYTTNSPSMDILTAGNLERFLYYLSDGDRQAVSRWQTQLAEQNKFTLPNALLEKMQRNWLAGYIDDKETEYWLRYVYHTYGYVCDPHTAVAYGVYEKVRRQLGEAHTVIMATAHPYKFPFTVGRALHLDEQEDPFAMALQIQANTGISVPPALGELATRPRRFTETVTPAELTQTVLDFAVMQRNRSDKNE